MNAQNQNQFQIPNNFSEKFGSESFAFFRQLLSAENSDWIKNNIESLSQQHPEMEEAKLIYELASLIKTEFVEDGLEKLSDLPNAYVDIICEAVYNADAYEIAKEVYQQYISFKKVGPKKEMLHC